MPRSPHDAFFKAIFGRIDHARAHLDAHLPSEARRLLDLSSLERVPASWVDAALRQRHADLLYRVRAIEGEVFLMLHLEHQSQPDRWIPLRLGGYTLRIWEQERSETPGRSALTPVLPMVIYHGRPSWSAPLRLSELIGGPDRLRRHLSRHLPDLEVPLLDLHRTPDARLDSGALEGLALLLMKHIRAPDLMAHLWRWAPRLGKVWRAPGGQRSVEQISRYVLLANEHARVSEFGRLVTETLGPEAKEIVVKSFGQKLFERGVREGRRKGEEEGRRRGEEEGRRRGEEEGRRRGVRSTLRRQLERRFGPLDPAVEAALEEAALDRLSAWAERVLEIEDPRELLN